MAFGFPAPWWFLARLEDSRTNFLGQQKNILLKRSLFCWSFTSSKSFEYSTGGRRGERAGCQDFAGVGRFVATKGVSPIGIGSWRLEKHHQAEYGNHQAEYPAEWMMCLRVSAHEPYTKAATQLEAPTKKPSAASREGSTPTKVFSESQKDLASWQKSSTSQPLCRVQGPGFGAVGVEVPF